jgi:predicted PurR-regulated permease PerM
VFFIVLQQVEANLMYPKMMGSRVNLPSLWILAAVTVGGSIGGPIGMILGVPVVSTAYTLVREETQKRENKQQETANAESPQATNEAVVSDDTPSETPPSETEI